MSLGRRYDVTRHTSLLLRDCTPGRYRKLNEEEIALEWARSCEKSPEDIDGTRTDNRHSLTFPRESNVRPSQSLNEGKRKGKGGKRPKSKSLTGKETLLRDIPLRSEDVVEDSSRRGQTSVSSVETDEGGAQGLVVDLSLTARDDTEPVVEPTFTEIQSSSVIVTPDQDKIKHKKEKKTKVKDKKRPKSKKNTCEVHKNVKHSKFKKLFDKKSDMDNPRHCSSCTCHLSETGHPGSKSDTSDTSSVSSSDRRSPERSRKQSSSTGASTAGPDDASRQKKRSDSGSSHPSSPSNTPRDEDKKDTSSDKSSQSSSPTVPKLKIKPAKPQRSPKSQPSTPEVNPIDVKDQVYLNQLFPVASGKLSDDDEGRLSEGRRTPGLICLSADTSLVLHDGDSFEMIGGGGFGVESDVDTGSSVSFDGTKKSDKSDSEASRTPNKVDSPTSSVPEMTTPGRDTRLTPLQINTLPAGSRPVYHLELSPPAGFKDVGATKVNGSAPDLPRFPSMSAKQPVRADSSESEDDKSDDELKAVWSTKDMKRNVPVVVGPKLDLDYGSGNGVMDKGPITCDVNIGKPNIEADICEPKVDIPVIDTDIATPNIAADAEIFTPDVKVHGEVLAPEVDHDVKICAPTLDGNVEMDVPEIRGPTMDSNISVTNPDADVSICAPKINCDSEICSPILDGPAIDADINVPKFNGPAFDAEFSTPQLEAPDINAETNLSSVNVPGLDTNINIPKVHGPDLNVSIDKPNADLPDLDTQVNIPNFDMPHFDPSIAIPQVNVPDVDLNADTNKPKVDIDVSAPKMNSPSLIHENEIQPVVAPDISPEISIPKMAPPAFKVDTSDLASDAKTPDGQKVALPTGPYVGIVVMAPDSDSSGPDKSVKTGSDVKHRSDLGTSTSESESSSTTSSSGSGKVKAKAKIEKPKRKGKHKKSESTEDEMVAVVQPTVSSSPATDSEGHTSSPIRRAERVLDISQPAEIKTSLEPSMNGSLQLSDPEGVSEYQNGGPSGFNGDPRSPSSNNIFREDSPCFRQTIHAPIPVLDISTGSAPDLAVRKHRPVSLSSDSDTSSCSDPRQRRGRSKRGDYSSEDNRDSYLSPASLMSSHSPLNVSQTLATTSNPNLNGFDKLEASFAHSTPVKIVDGSMPSIVRHRGHFVVVAIDFGTTFSGYALSFTRDPESVHMMRNWEGGDPGVINQKTPTTILLSPDGEFDSFGFTARDRYHNLTPDEAKKWLYFERFKMVLHHNADLTRETMLTASNGQSFPALKVFALALRFFKEHALQQLSDQSGITIINDDVRWVITVPAIWKAPAKQFMRQAAYEADLVSPDAPDQLLIALEPEAASIYCRKLRMYQLVPEYPEWRPLQSPRYSTPEPLNEQPACTEIRDDVARPPFDLPPDFPLENKIKGTRYMVVDCGGGTVDITVHELGEDTKLKELYKATGGPYGATAVDDEFINMLCDIFGHEFIAHYRAKYPVGWLNLMINWESRKRSASPFKNSSLNVSLPFTFIDYFKKQKGGNIEHVVKKYGNKGVCWSSEGMLRLTPHAMRCLFVPVMEKINMAIGDVLNHPNARNLKYLFLVGGFAESPILQHDIRKEFSPILKVLIPTGVSLAILKGAVLFGLDPTIVNIRRSRLTYGVGVLNRFDPSRHPTSKLVHREGIDWCTDVFDVFVQADQPVTMGDSVIRSYTPAKLNQMVSVIHIYSSEDTDAPFITDPGVKKCGSLCLDLSDLESDSLPTRREIQARMMFGDTEIKVSALDVATGRCVRASIDFLNK